MAATAFFEQQRQAKRLSQHLLLAYVLAMLTMVVLTTLLLVKLVPWGYATADQAWLWQRSAGFWGWTAFGVATLVLGGTLYKLAKLSRGGQVVAEEMGARRIWAKQADREERRLLNVVEEMAIAAGLPLPKVYLLEEGDINAFAAGLHPKDAVIAVTRGALDQLSRDELQAVVAHEFSHILNGDMRLNMHLSAFLHGLMLIGLCGRWLLWLPKRDDIDDGARRRVLVLGWYGGVLGVTLALLGAVGTVLAGWLQAGVSRQREFLADASAVQFTRQQAGLIAALTKIAQAPQCPPWRRWATPEYAHFYFASTNEQDWFSYLSATHPPIRDRVARLDERAAQDMHEFEPKHFRTVQASDPGWRGFGPSFTKPLPRYTRATPYWLQPIHADTQLSSLTEKAEPALTLDSQRVLADINTLNPTHLLHAAWLRQHLPAAVYAASQEPEAAESLMCALLLSEDAFVRQQQCQSIQAAHYALGLRVTQLWPVVATLPRYEVMPVVDLSLPALAALPRLRWKKTRRLLHQLMIADNHVSVHEWCVWSVLNAHLQPSNTAPAVKSGGSTQTAMAVILAWTIRLSSLGDGAAVYQNACDSWCENGAGWPNWTAMQTTDMAELQAACRLLQGVDAQTKAWLLQAVLTILHAEGGHLDVTKREWMRALSAWWQYPMPPLLPQRPTNITTQEGTATI